MSSARPGIAAAGVPTPRKDRRGAPLSGILMEDGLLSARVALGAMAEAERLDQPLARVIEAEGLAGADAILQAEAERLGALVLRRETHPPAASAMGWIAPDLCLKHGILPWMHIGSTLVVATAHPDRFEAAMASLPRDLGPVMMALTRETDIHEAIADRYGAALARQAESRRPAEDSCRDLREGMRGAAPLAALLAIGCAAVLWIAPNLLFAGALALALVSLVVSQALKLIALVASRAPARPAAPPIPGADAPVVSILVPLYREEAIAERLVARLSRLTYPRSLLDIVLILEHGDARTEAALAGASLPPWFRVLRVPPGSVTTKPRALNYALRFARGTIIGIYDAEDAPDPDQIDRVVAEFARAPRRVACLQGVLDFYNARANWLSRCFAIEYATWFRVMLPGLARLGLPIPLGGTTLFLRREALETVGGWDAHNVTEDADLGILLARRGYVTRMIQTDTREEANARLWPWIRQRSRWLKGYAITWWVHSRSPLRLWRDLGPRRFFGMQALVLGTVLSFLLAPVLWSFWLIVFGLPHPLDGTLGPEARRIMIALFLSAEAVSIAAGLVAVARSPHRGLMPWVPTLFLYFPLGTLALYKGVWEVLRRPFYWDKTQHGRFDPDSPEAEMPADRRPGPGIVPKG